MIEYVPYKPEHFMSVVEESTENGISFSFESVAMFHSNHPATTSIVDGKIAGCFGITKKWDGVAIVWAVFNETARATKIEFHRNAKIFIDDLSKSFHRLQCEVIGSNENSKKFVESLGFNKECVLQGYGPDKQDFILYARVNI